MELTTDNILTALRDGHAKLTASMPEQYIGIVLGNGQVLSVGMQLSTLARHSQWNIPSNYFNRISDQSFLLQLIEHFEIGEEVMDPLTSFFDEVFFTDERIVILECLNMFGIVLSNPTVTLVVTDDIAETDQVH